jgi:hypothetical protein
MLMPASRGAPPEKVPPIGDTAHVLHADALVEPACAGRDDVELRRSLAKVRPWRETTGRTVLLSGPHDSGLRKDKESPE